MADDIEVTTWLKCTVCGNDEVFTAEYRHLIAYQDFTYIKGSMLTGADGSQVPDVDYDSTRDEDFSFGADRIWCGSAQCADNDVIVWERANDQSTE